jgi:hypothetical protein
MTMPHVPAPGSAQAHKMGCTCLAEFNHYGQVPPIPDGQWWITPCCPLHEQWLRAAAEPHEQRVKGTRRGR